MNKDEAKDLIVEHITRVQGCKSTELAAAWSASLNGEHTSVELGSLLEELIAEKRIVEVSYVLANMEYREKSFYLPGKTQVIIDGC
jgi:hypothetical protein